MLTVGTGFALFDHVHIIAQGTEQATKKVCKRLRQDVAPVA
jgi:urocanate hydratase